MRFHKTISNKVPLVLFFIFIINILHAQSKIIFSGLTREDGLPHNIVNSICLDKKGFIYLATGDGLACYNGYDFKVYRYNEVDPNSLPDNICIKIATGFDGKIWVLTEKNLVLFNPEKETFKTISNKSHQQIIFMDSSEVWFDCLDSISVYDIETKKIRSFKWEPKGSGFSKVKNSLMYVSDTSIYIRNLDNGTTSQITSCNSTLEKQLLYINDSLLFTCADKFLLKYNTEKKYKKTYTLNSDKSGGSIFYDHIFNKVWVGTSSSGLFIVDHLNNQIQNCQFENFNNEALKSNNISDFFIDNSGILWVGTIDGGVSKTDLYRKKFNKITPDFLSPNSLNDKVVTSVFEDRDNNLWIGTSNKGINVIDKNNNYHYFSSDQRNKNSLAADNIATILQDSAGSIWAISWAGYLYKIDFKKNTVTSFKGSKRWNDKDPKNLVYGYAFRSMAYDGGRYIWIGGFNGFERFDILKGESDMLLLCDENNPKTIRNEFINIVYISPYDSQKIWIGTNRGISLYDINKNEFNNFYDSLSIQAMQKYSITAFCEYPKGILWIALPSMGIMKLNISDFKNKIYTIKDGLPGDNILGLLHDNENNIWISSSDGISKFNIKSETFRNFDELDGLPGKEYKMGSYFKSTSGELFFGSTNGLVRFFPNEIKDNEFLPALAFTGLRVKDRKVNINDTVNKQVILTKNIAYTTGIVINYKNNDFSIEFAALQYNNPLKHKYKYRLEGYDDEWRETDAKKRFAHYANLPSGKYVFKVIGSNNDGKWNNDPAVMEIVVLPPWWATWWFRSAMVLLIVGSAIGFYRYRVNALKREKQVLEMRVAERTAELSEANAQLEERQEEILAQKEELETKNEQVSRAYDNMQLLSDFGQKITATLNLDAINQMIYDYVSSLMDTQAFGIGIYNEKRKVIEFLHFVEDGKVLPYFTKELTSANSLSVRCFTNKEEIVIGNLSEEYQRYLAALPEVQTKKMPVSMVHLPLVVEGRAIGTLTVNSFRADAYGPNELNNLRSLASYISIALDNASVYKVLRFTNEKVQNSIEYARTIQQAILPLREEMDKYFESFVLFRPKDVVSGDFYWMQVVDGAIYFAVVDCTGHGVPGAFMSLIGSRLLDEIVKEKGIRQPSQILEALDHELGIALRQGETENNDGMDVCLIKLEGEKLKVERGKRVEGMVKEGEGNMGWALTFSGAMRPLYLMQNGVLSQLKGDRRSIGGKRTTRKTSIAYTDQRMEITTGTTLYLSSDGYADQNNANHDKFGVLAYEKLLTTIAQQPLEEQLTRLNNALDTHMGNEEQRDDITVVGLKV